MLTCLTARRLWREYFASGVDAVVFFLAFYTVFYFTDKYTQVVVIMVAAIAGQTLYHN